MSLRGVFRVLRARADYALGVTAMRMGRLSFAMRRFRAVLAVRPDHLAALHYLAWTMLSLSRLEESVAYYKQFIRGVPDHSAAYEGLGSALQQLGRHEEAIDAFKAALDRDPNSPVIQYNLAQSLLACGKVQDALVLYRRVVRLQPNNAHAVGNFGATLGQLGHWLEALECHQMAMALEPNLNHAHNLAVTLFELDRFEEAEQAFRRALEFAPDSNELKLRLAMAMAEGGKREEALHQVRAVLRDDPNDLTALGAMIAVLILDNQLDASIEVAMHSVRQHPNAAVAHEALGWAYLKQGNSDSALRCYEQAIALDSQNVELHAGRGAALSQLGRHADAMESFNVVNARLPGFLNQYPEFSRSFSDSQKAVAAR